MAVLHDLPGEIPVFPLSGVLLLPRGTLPLHVFEARYVAMVEDALRGDRLIGIIQPRLTEPDGAALFETGCAGKITTFTETPDGRYFITLTGICRFDLAGELPPLRGYRRVQADWSKYGADLNPVDCLDLDRVFLRELLESYFNKCGLSCDWAMIDGAEDDRLITALAMICPLDAGEKQALLEAQCCKRRAALFVDMLRMAVCGDCDCNGQPSPRH